MQRKHFVTRRDCLNLSTKVYEQSIRRHENDAVSTDLIVNELGQEEYNPVLAYKPQGVLCVQYPNLKKEGFILVIQTKFQKEQYEKYAPTILCLDSTHNTNAYGFKLSTLMVADDHHEGELYGAQ